MQAPKPSPGPHKSRESIPLAILLRNRLKYALTYDEVKKICMQRLVKVDGKVRTDKTFPCGFQGELAVCVQSPYRQSLSWCIRVHWWLLYKVRTGKCFPCSGRLTVAG